MNIPDSSVVNIEEKKIESKNGVKRLFLVKKYSKQVHSKVERNVIDSPDLKKKRIRGDKNNGEGESPKKMGVVENDTRS